MRHQWGPILARARALRFRDRGTALKYNDHVSLEDEIRREPWLAAHRDAILRLAREMDERRDDGVIRGPGF